MPDRIVTTSSVPTPANSSSASRAAVVSYMLGGRKYPMTSEPRCKVCQSDSRVDIERRVLHGYGPTAIHRGLSEDVREHISVRNISDHSRSHLPVDLVVRQAIVEARAREVGVDIEQATSTLVDRISFAKVGLQQVYERLVDGDIKPTMTDGIALAQFLQKVDEQSGAEAFSQDMAARGFMAYMRAMQQVCTPEQIRQMARLINEDPIMAMMLQQGQRTVVIDATPSEDG